MKPILSGSQTVVSVTITQREQWLRIVTVFDAIRIVVPLPLSAVKAVMLLNLSRQRLLNNNVIVNRLYITATNQA
jgi:hypothetical protein